MKFTYQYFNKASIKARKRFIRKAIIQNGLFTSSGVMQSRVSQYECEGLDNLLLVRHGRHIIGWSAMFEGVLHDPALWNKTYGHVGAFIAPEYRGQGLAKKAVIELLTRVKLEPYVYDVEAVGYSKRVQDLFLPLLRKKGFKGRATDYLSFG